MNRARLGGLPKSWLDTTRLYSSALLPVISRDSGWIARRTKLKKPREAAPEAYGCILSGWLGEEDSNLHRRLQRPLSCHWTIPQQMGLIKAEPGRRFN
jgi:hypothetical protein